jgi:hypothetical protein
MGVPAGSGWNELDCSLCDELDHVSLLRECLRSPPWRRGRGDCRTDHSACVPWFCSDADLLVHPVLDVPPEDVFEDLTRWPTVREEGFSAGFDWPSRPISSEPGETSRLVGRHPEESELKRTHARLLATHINRVLSQPDYLIRKVYYSRLWQI